MSWLLVPLTLAGAVAVVWYRLPTVVADPVVAVVAVGAQAVLGALLLLLLWAIDPLRPLGRPWIIVATAVVWGGGMCVFLSGFLNEQIDAVAAKLSLDPDLVLSAPVIEEAVKLLGVLALIGVGRRWVRDPLDGFVLGAAVGIGFLTVENVTYALSAAAEARDAAVPVTEAVTQSLLVRSALAVGSHSLYAGIAGFGLAALIVLHGRGRTGRGIAVFAAALTTTLAAHLLWDAEWGLTSPANVIPPAVIAVALVVIAAVLLRRGRLRLRTPTPAPADAPGTPASAP
ncbi:hypothetical protein GCM10009851_20640 [Herbiconiux moechotypicola]|uniref:PrsW family intramembrane metalloprotease n=2 Tax=Herbiconiux moechotypicola TaxID=637393 RepID=A0ABP5QJX6_9MICO